MSPKRLVAAVMAALLSVPVSAQSVKAGIEAWQRADYSSAVAIWRPLAQRGDADAEFNLGQAYRLGRGVTLDLAAAKSWFERAADAGHLDAQTTLGLLLFQNGDQTSGLKWLRRAAEQGEPRALLVYGTALYNGDGVTQDRILGYAYIHRAAGQGLAPARDTLAQLDNLMPESDKKKALLLAEVAPRAASPALPKHEKPVQTAQQNSAPAKAAVPARVESKPPRIKSVAVKTVSAQKPVPAAHGNWRIQLGAFSQHASAEALYRRVESKPPLAGRNAVYVTAGPVTRLQVGPYESRAAAATACAAVGTACCPVPAK